MAKNRMTVCKSCNASILKKAKVCPNCGVKNQRPFYKRGWFLFLVAVVALAALLTIASDDTEKFKWSDFELSHLLPEPESNKGRVLTDTEDNLSIYISKSSKEEYKAYVDECKDRGFVIESEKTDSNYSAYNKDGFKVVLWYNESDKEYRIDLYAQEEMTELEWPSKGIGSMLPDPYESIGKITRDDSDYFSVVVGEMDKEDFKYYIEDCEEAGFTMDYSKTDISFSAKNEDGFSLTVNYAGFNTVKITLDKPDDKTDVNEPTSEDNKLENDEDSRQEIKGIRTEFKKAMDSYEGFMDEYVEFMKKYNESNGNDLTLLTDYANYMSKYTKFVEDFEKWDDEDMSPEETAYYLQVQSRVYKKLSEI